MTFGELRTLLLQTLNRRDITSEQLTFYIQGAIQRAQRLIRTPAGEKISYFIIGENFYSIPVPPDFLRLTSMVYNDKQEVIHSDLTTVLQLDKAVGPTRYFCRVGDFWRLGPKPNLNDTFTITYSADYSKIEGANDENWLTIVAPDIIISGAMSAACRFYVDPRRDSYEADFVQAISDLNVQAWDDELVNAQVSPGLNFDVDSY